ncbi:MAG TPA: hypothetical protein VJP78_03900, partial [Thermoleophilia bacterium]|nr:hypothetical protein [Thermoleophilia bacterium]
ASREFKRIWIGYDAEDAAGIIFRQGQLCSGVIAKWGEGICEAGRVTDTGEKWTYPAVRKVSDGISYMVEANGFNDLFEVDNFRVVVMDRNGNVAQLTRERARGVDVAANYVLTAMKKGLGAGGEAGAATAGILEGLWNGFATQMADIAELLRKPQALIDGVQALIDNLSRWPSAPVVPS